MLLDIISKCKKIPVKKVALNFQCPVDIRNDFVSLAKKHNITFTALLVSLMSLAVEDDKQNKDISLEDSK